MRLLKLDPIVQTGIRDGFISMGHGRALINCASPELQIKFYKAIVKKGLSVRATEDLVRNEKNSTSSTTSNYQPAYIKQAAEDLERFFETPFQSLRIVWVRANLKLDLTPKKNSSIF